MGDTQTQIQYIVFFLVNCLVQIQTRFLPETNIYFFYLTIGRRVRRHVKPGCSIAVLPSSEIIIIDPESNCISILDRRGKFRYGMSNSNKPCGQEGLASNSAQFGTAAFGHLPRLDRGVRLLTPQGTLIVKLMNESTVSSPPPSSLIGSVESTPVSSRGSVTKERAPIADNDEVNDEE